MTIRLRSFLGAAHQWIGLSFGVLFVLLGLTGSLLVFYPVVDERLNPSLRAQPAARAISLSQVVNALHAAEPSRQGAWRIELPGDETSPVLARYMNPVETGTRTFAPLVVTLDPATLAVTSKRFWSEYFVTWIYDLHYTLLLDRGGRTLLAVCAVFLLLLLASGVYLWWPGTGHWAAAFRMKAGASTVRRVYDLHTRPGIYGIPLAVMFVVTGLVLEVPQWFKPAINCVSPLVKFFDVPPASGLSEPGIVADEAVRIALEQFPAATVRWIETPVAEHPFWRVQLRQDGEPNRHFPRTNVWIDAHSGKVLAVRDPRKNSAGDSLMDWLHPLHNGEAFGLSGRIVVFLGGLLPLLAFITGFVRWRHKVCARRKSRDKARRQRGDALRDV